MLEKKLYFEHPRQLSLLYCEKEKNLTEVEKALHVSLVTRENWLLIKSEDSSCIEKVEILFSLLDQGRSQGLIIREGDFRRFLRSTVEGKTAEIQQLFEHPCILDIKGHTVIPRTLQQKSYLQMMQQQEVVFGIGPAGTGKTFLAIAAALHALIEERVQRLVLTRPAVEAGEALGFLPSDLIEKIDPYLRPFYDAMFEILGKEKVLKLIEREMIEIAPLAYMRDRTLARSFIILDEAQNTTCEQMMMFLTRLGESSQIVITEDLTQIDLPHTRQSGLVEASKIFTKTKGIGFSFFEAKDVMRHSMVERIIEAYEAYHKRKDKKKTETLNR